MNDDYIALDFKDSLPKELLELLSFLWSRDFHPYFVGGCVRDFIILQGIAKDIDIELHYSQILDEVSLKQLWEKLFSSLASKYEVKSLPYNVIRIIIGEHEVELSPPRTESFKKSKSKGHHDFDCYIHSQLPLMDSFKRRDLTINAMAVGFKENGSAHFYDPYKGLEDLSSRKLRQCSFDFANDPVRLLRTLRFYFKYGFKISEELESVLCSMSLEKISHFYVWEEALKSGRFFLFLKKIGQTTVELEPQLKELISLILEQEEKLDDWYGRLLRFFSSQERGKVVFLVLGLDSLIKTEAKKSICDYFQISNKFLQRVQKIKESSSFIFTHANSSQLFRISELNFHSFDSDFLKIVNQLQKIVQELNWPIENSNVGISLLEEIEILIKPEFNLDARNLYFLLSCLSQKVSADELEFKQEKIEIDKRGQYLTYLSLKQGYSHAN